jgi:predicted RNA polymerase sigma factor
MGSDNSSASLKDQFNELMLHTYHEAAKLGYRATYFLQMVARLGAVAAAKELVANPTYSSGFTQLWELKRLDLSAEVLILREEFHEFFDDEHRVMAKTKLPEYGYFQR